MLSFNNIGNLGRLANQMFQLASLIGISENNGYDYCVPEKNVFGHSDMAVRESPHNIVTVFPNTYRLFESKKGNPLFKRYPETTHNFDEQLFNNCPDNVDLFGYYQSPKYFQNVEDKIHGLFAFEEGVVSDCLDLITKELMLGGSELIALHIRRGDYVYNPNHPVQPIEYYEKALEKMPEDIPVIVFSDDAEWCSKQELFDGDRFMISEGNEAHYDMCLMTRCDYHIIANSSFSWWGAWLGKSKKIVAPKDWFGADCVYKDVHDMEFGNWSWL